MIPIVRQAGIVLLILGGFVCIARPQEKNPEPGIGPGARIFVTKCYPAQGKLSDADFQQLADAGFTVVVNRWVFDYPEYSRKAAKVGLDVMSWGYGMVAAEKPEQSIVTREGKTISKYPPCDPEGWKKISDLLYQRAELSRKQPNVKGAVLDFEVYSKNKTDGYCESYDDRTFTSFLRSCGMAIPESLLLPEKRREYLVKKGLLKKFIRYQYNQVASEVKAIRKRLDAINPRFQIGVYGWGALIDAVLENITSQSAPVIRMDAVAYGRTIYSSAFAGGYDANEPDRRGLRWSLCETVKRRNNAASKGYPIVYLAGHYPQSPGPADGTAYKFTVRQSFNSAAYADGYWIWTDWKAPKSWPSKQAWIDAMMKYWQEANTALDKGNFTWSSRQDNQVCDPQITLPLSIVTKNEIKATFWHPITGKKYTNQNQQDILPNKDYSNSISGKKIIIRNKHIEIRDTANGGTKKIHVGKALHGFAVGDVDTVPGDELVTLNDGWVKYWDIDSGACLLRFFVGSDQKNVSLIYGKKIL